MQRIKRYRLVLLAVLSLCVIGAAAQPRGYGPPGDPLQSLYRDCKVSVAISDKKIEHPEALQWASDVRCISYLHGFLDGVSWTKPKSICAPDGTKISEVAKKYVQYVDKYPSQQRDNEQFGVLFGLGQAYPCSAEK